ncbi:MAG: hypothetical protein WBG92_15760 [Thiohalocapsa sp.]
MDSNLYENLLSRLAGVIRTGDGRWSARCPAHEDRSPSLSVRNDGDRILFHCHAGCHPDDVLAAVGLAWRDLYPDKWQAAHRAAIATGNYLHRKRRTRELRDGIDLDVERSILRIVAADLRAGKALTIEDLGRVEVARQRVMAAREKAA